MTLRISGTYDIECADWDRFRVGEILHDDGSHFVSWDADVFYDALRRCEGTYWAHSGGRYDALWALDMAFRRGDVPVMVPRGAGLMTLEIGTVTLSDSAAVWPDKLATVARIAGREKSSVGLACHCGKRGCEGYCALARDLTPRERALVEDYLHNDCSVLFDALTVLSERATDDGFALRPTVGSTAWHTAKKWLDLPGTSHDLGRWRQIEEGSYGGRVEVYRPEEQSGHRFDRHASYPASLVSTDLPTGEPHTRDATDAGRLYSHAMPGVYQASLYMPEQHIPPLPVREGERILFPHGPISGAWAQPELAYAEECGARITRIDGAITWPDASPWLAGYAQRVWALRETADRGGAADKAYAKWLKWAANSLTGKVSQKCESDDYEYRETPPGDVPEADDGDPIIRVTRHGTVLGWVRTRISACSHIEAGVYLRADARIEQHRQLAHAGDDAIYGDTDSSHARRMLTRRLGDALGEWGYEGPMDEWSALAPKLYRFRCRGCKDHPAPGDWHVKGKGYSGLTPEGFDDLTAGLPWTIDRGVRGFRDVLSHDPHNPDAPAFVRKHLDRRHTPAAGWIGGRERGSDGMTRATTVDRYRSRVVGGGWFGE